MEAGLKEKMERHTDTSAHVALRFGLWGQLCSSLLEGVSIPRSPLVDTARKRQLHRERGHLIKIGSLGALF